MPPFLSMPSNRFAGGQNGRGVIPVANVAHRCHDSVELLPWLHFCAPLGPAHEDGRPAIAIAESTVGDGQKVLSTFIAHIVGSQLAASQVVSQSWCAPLALLQKLTMQRARALQLQQQHGDRSTATARLVGPVRSPPSRSRFRSVARSLLNAHLRPEETPNRLRGRGDVMRMCIESVTPGPTRESREERGGREKRKQEKKDVEPEGTHGHGQDKLSRAQRVR